MKTRVPRSAVAARKRASSAGLPAESAQPRGLPVKSWSASQPSASALASAPSTSPLPTRTWVPTGLRRVGSTMVGTLSAGDDRTEIAGLTGAGAVPGAPVSGRCARWA